jgi:hypothetical protein
MKEVFVHQDHAQVGLYKSVLDAAGISSYIRNEYSHQIVTPRPTDLFYPTLCVVNDEDYERALEIIAERQAPEAPAGPDWTCADCGEEVPGTFGSCWKCGALRRLTSG